MVNTVTPEEDTEIVLQLWWLMGSGAREGSSPGTSSVLERHSQPWALFLRIQWQMAWPGSMSMPCDQESPQYREANGPVYKVQVSYRFGVPQGKLQKFCQIRAPL